MNRFDIHHFIFHLRIKGKVFMIGAIEVQHKGASPFYLYYNAKKGNNQNYDYYLVDKIYFGIFLPSAQAYYIIKRNLISSIISVTITVVRGRFSISFKNFPFSILHSLEKYIFLSLSLRYFFIY